MNARLFDEVHELALDIVEASSDHDKKSEWAAYTVLRELCEYNERTEHNHPFQWETLGDFTANNSKAVSIYQKALDLAEDIDEIEYIASIKLALAERYFAAENYERAYQLAFQANDVAKKTDDLELRQEISELLLELVSKA